MGRKNGSNNIRDPVLKLLRDKTSSWKNSGYYKEKTKTSLSPKLKELYSYSALFTVNRQKFTWRDGHPLETEINPESTYNFLVVESRMGNDKEGSGYGIQTETVHEGEPRDIPPESLELRLNKLYKKARLESFKSFVESYMQSNVYDSEKYFKDLEITTSSRRTRRVSDPKRSLFIKLEPVQPAIYIQDQKNSKLEVPTVGIQRLLEEVGRELMGNNTADENGFESKASIEVINETWRYANSEGSMIREHFSGYDIHYKITFNSPRSGEGCSIDWGHGINRPDIRRYKQLLKKQAKLLNHDFNSNFNNSNAVSISPGRWECYLEPESFSTHIHEAVVHTCASDEIVKHLLYPDNEDDFELPFTLEEINTQVGHPDLQIIFDPRKKHSRGGLYWGGFLYDHEAVESKRFNIIKNGVLTNLLADRGDSYLINNIFGEKVIRPGSSRFGVVDDSYEIETQSPRTSVMIINWKKKLSRVQLWRKFLNRIKNNGKSFRYKGKSKKAGLWFKRTTHGLTSEEGYSKGYNNLVNIVFEDGKYIPVRDFIYTTASPKEILRNIQGIGSIKEHVTGHCGVGSGGELIARESVLCGPGIINDLEVRKSPEMSRRYEN